MDYNETMCSLHIHTCIFWNILNNPETPCKIDFFIIQATRARKCLAIRFPLSSEWEWPARMSHYKGRDIPSVRCLLRTKETEYILERLLWRICVLWTYTHATYLRASPHAVRPLRLFSMNVCTPKISPHRMTTRAITRIFVIFSPRRCGLSFMALLRWNNRK